jgi:hypothetical protein
MPNRILRTLVATLCLCHAGWACATSTTTPGGVYHLRRGIYVAEGSQCDAPANAAIRLYTGKGIDTAHTRACYATVQAHDGSDYVVEQTCIDAGAGPGPRFTERQHIVIRNTWTFVQRIGRDGTVYHYCPSSQLPADLRSAVD